MLISAEHCASVLLIHAFVREHLTGCPRKYHENNCLTSIIVEMEYWWDLQNMVINNLCVYLGLFALFCL